MLIGLDKKDSDWIFFFVRLPQSNQMMDVFILQVTYLLSYLLILFASTLQIYQFYLLWSEHNIE